jgi:hypothetical protein
MPNCSSQSNYKLLLILNDIPSFYKASIYFKAKIS